MAQPERTETETPDQEAWFPQTIGERIRFIRERRRLRQNELAAAMAELGVPVAKSMLSRFERYGSDDPNARRPQLEHVLAIARVLRVAPVDLGVTFDEYPEIRFLRDPKTQALLEATASFLSGNRTSRRRRRAPRPVEARQPPLLAEVGGRRG